MEQKRMSVQWNMIEMRKRVKIAVLDWHGSFRVAGVKNYGFEPEKQAGNSRYIIHSSGEPKDGRTRSEQITMDCPGLNKAQMLCPELHIIRHQMRLKSRSRKRSDWEGGLPRSMLSSPVPGVLLSPGICQLAPRLTFLKLISGLVQ